MKKKCCLRIAVMLQSALFVLLLCETSTKRFVVEAAFTQNNGILYPRSRYNIENNDYYRYQNHNNYYYPLVKQQPKYYDDDCRSSRVRVRMNSQSSRDDFDNGSSSSGSLGKSTTKNVDSNGTIEPSAQKFKFPNVFNMEYEIDEECVVGDSCLLSQDDYDEDDYGIMNGNNNDDDNNNNKEYGIMKQKNEFLSSLKQNEFLSSFAAAAGGESSSAISSKIAVIDNILNWIPVLMPAIAYILYDPVSTLFHNTVEMISIVVYGKRWVTVDGGTYQAQIITPAINGIVLPSVSILFATLIGTTITTLRQRQLDIRNCINMEAGQIRILQSMFFTTTNNNNNSNNDSNSNNINNNINNNNNNNNAEEENNNNNQQLQHLEKCRYYLIQYTSRLINEGDENVNANSLDLSGMDSELNGILTELNYASHYMVSSSSSEKLLSLSPSMMDQCYVACNRLFEERAKRITYLQSTFPILHYITVTALAASICVGFLMETDQEVLEFLSGLQLRILWTVLVGTFSALVSVVYDLSNPFRGSYQISKSIDQLYTVRQALRASSSSLSSSSSSSFTQKE